MGEIPSTSGAERRKCILVADADEQERNQVLAMLRHDGHDAVEATSASELLELFCGQGFDAVLIDIGLLAGESQPLVHAMRQHELTTGGNALLVALQDQDVLSTDAVDKPAGIDVVLGKPLSLHQLKAAVESHHAGLEGAAEPPLDLKRLMEELEDDKSLMRHLAGVLEADIERSLTSLRNAIEQGDLAELERTAHNLRGALGTFRARDSFLLAENLEVAAKQKNLSRARTILGNLEHELLRLQEFLMSAKTLA